MQTNVLTSWYSTANDSWNFPTPIQQPCLFVRLDRHPSGVSHILHTSPNVLWSKRADKSKGANIA